MDIKAWLDQAGEPVAETCFLPGDVPPLPYICFRDEQGHGGADMKNILTIHNMTVERYSVTSECNSKLEALFDEKGLEYTREQIWLPDPDDMYETIYMVKTPLIERTEI